MRVWVFVCTDVGGGRGVSHLWCGAALIIAFLCRIKIQQSALRGLCMSTSVCVIWYNSIPGSHCSRGNGSQSRNGSFSSANFHQRDATSDQFIMLLFNNPQPSLRIVLNILFEMIKKKNLNTKMFYSASPTADGDKVIKASATTLSFTSQGCCCYGSELKWSRPPPAMPLRGSVAGFSVFSCQHHHPRRHQHHFCRRDCTDATAQMKARLMSPH